MPFPQYSLESEDVVGLNVVIVLVVGGRVVAVLSSGGVGSEDVGLSVLIPLEVGGAVVAVLSLGGDVGGIESLLLQYTGSEPQYP